jgi:hypothetical protein
VVVLAWLALLVLEATSSTAEAATCQGTAITSGSSDRLLCSKNFYGSGTCSGQDTLAVLKDADGWPNLPYVPPWEPSSISIVGIAMVDLGGTVNQYAFAGNSYTPDIMFWHPLTSRAASVFFPPGTAMPFPASGGANPPHLDAHISCTGGGTFQIFYTIFYTVP